MDEQGHVLNRTALNGVAETERGQSLLWSPQCCHRRRATGQADFHLFLSVGEAVLPTPSADTGVFATPFVAFIEFEIQSGLDGVLTAKEVKGDGIHRPGREVAHVPVCWRQGNKAPLHAHDLLAHDGSKRQRDVGPSVVGMVANLRLCVGHRTREFGVVDRGVRQHPG